MRLKPTYIIILLLLCITGSALGKQVSDSLFSSRKHLRLGTIYNDNEMYKAALEELECISDIGNIKIRADIHYEKGRSYMGLGLKDNALEDYKSASSLFRQIRDTTAYVNSNIEIAGIYSNYNSNKKAEELLNACLPWVSRNKYRSLHTRLLLELSKLDIINSCPVLAEEKLTKAAKLSSDRSMKKDRAMVLYHIGLKHKDKGETDLAITHFSIARDIARKNKFDEILLLTEKELTDLYSILREYEKTFSHRKNLYKLKDSLRTLQRDTQMEYLGLIHDSDEKERDLDILRKEDALNKAYVSRQKRLRFYSVVLLVLLTVAAAFSLSNYFRKRRVTRLLKHKNSLLKGTREKLLKNEKKLKNMQHTRTKLFSVMAHDLLNPFNALLGYATLLQEGRGLLNLQEIKQYSGAIHESALILYAQMENLLQWSFSQEGKIVARKSEQDLGKLIDSLLILVRPMAENKNITIETHIEKDCRIMADADLISSAVRNLVQNAIKFSPKGSSIHIKGEYSTTEACIEVNDHGVGISRYDQDRIMKEGNSFTTMGTGNESGAGLGLLITREFVRLNDGSITLESETGRGSSFKICLPA